MWHQDVDCPKLAVISLLSVEYERVMHLLVWRRHLLLGFGRNWDGLERGHGLRIGLKELKVASASGLLFTSVSSRVLWEHWLIVSGSCLLNLLTGWSFANSILQSTLRKYVGKICLDLLPPRISTSIWCPLRRTRSLTLVSRVYASNMSSWSTCSSLCLILLNLLIKGIVTLIIISSFFSSQKSWTVVRGIDGMHILKLPSWVVLCISGARV